MANHPDVDVLKSNRMAVLFASQLTISVPAALRKTQLEQVDPELYILINYIFLYQ